MPDKEGSIVMESNVRTLGCNLGLSFYALGIFFHLQPVPGIKGTLGNKRYLRFQVDILDMTYQLSTPELTTIIPIVAAGSDSTNRYY